MTSRSPTPFSQLRTQAGISIEALADMAGFSPRTVYRWENGEVSPRRAAIELLKRIIADRPCEAAQGDPAFRFIDLFADGLRQTRARWPNGPPAHPASYADSLTDARARTA